MSCSFEQDTDLCKTASCMNAGSWIIVVSDELKQKVQRRSSESRVSMHWVWKQIFLSWVSRKHTHILYKFIFIVYYIVAVYIAMYNNFFTNETFLATFVYTRSKKIWLCVFFIYLLSWYYYACSYDLGPISDNTTKTVCLTMCECVSGLSFRWYFTLLHTAQTKSVGTSKKKRGA